MNHDAAEQLRCGFDQVQAAVASADSTEVDRLLMVVDGADLAHDAYALAMEQLRVENCAAAARWLRVAYRYGIAEAQELLKYCHDTPQPVDTEPVPQRLILPSSTAVLLESLDERILDAEQRRAQRRARLIEAAFDEFTSKGYAKTTIADLCARAGITSKAFYTRYGSKEMLLLELHAHINRLVLKRMVAMLDSLAQADVVTRVTTLVGAFVEGVTSDPRYPRLLYIEAPGASRNIDRQYQDWFARYTLFLEAQFDRAAYAGFVPQRSYRVTTINLVGAVTELLRAWRTSQPSTPPAIIANQIRAMTIDMVTRCTYATGPEPSSAGAAHG